MSFRQRLAVQRNGCGRRPARPIPIWGPAGPGCDGARRGNAGTTGGTRVAALATRTDGGEAGMTVSHNREHAAIVRQLTAFPQLRVALGADLVAALELINLDYDALSGWPGDDVRRIVQEAGYGVLGALRGSLA